MKSLSLMLLLFGFMTACQDDNTVNEDEVIIEREEDYNRESPDEEPRLPVDSPDEVDIN